MFMFKRRRRKKGERRVERKRRRGEEGEEEEEEHASQKIHCAHLKGKQQPINHKDSRPPTCMTITSMVSWSSMPSY